MIDRRVWSNARMVIRLHILLEESGDIGIATGKLASEIRDEYEAITQELLQKLNEYKRVIDEK
jgi:hypothetical protein